MENSGVSILINSLILSSILIVDCNLRYNIPSRTDGEIFVFIEFISYMQFLQSTGRERVRLHVDRYRKLDMRCGKMSSEKGST